MNDRNDKEYNDLLNACKKAFAVMIDIRSYPVAMAQLGPICKDGLDGAIETCRRALIENGINL
jgi:hypothetical protein